MEKMGIIFLCVLVIISTVMDSGIASITFDPQSLVPESTSAISDDDNNTCTNFQETASSAAVMFTKFRVKDVPNFIANFSVELTGHTLGCNQSLYLAPLSTTQTKKWFGRWKLCRFLTKTERSDKEHCSYSCSAIEGLEALQVIKMPNTPEEYNWQICHINMHGKTAGLCAGLAIGENSVKLPGDSLPTSIYCTETQDAKGWIVLMQRESNSVNFYVGWEEYKIGFGQHTGNFWSGNEFMHKATTAGTDYRLRVMLITPSDERIFAEYSTFWVDSEANNYKLHVSGYLPTSTADDALRIHNGMMFSTLGRDNSPSSTNLTNLFHAGWWFNDDQDTVLTAVFDKGIIWHNNIGNLSFALFVQMMIRPNP